MTRPPTIDSPSPDARHTARLVPAGEIRFGPLYYVLSIDGREFGERIFGEAHCWSPSSQLLAVQEWLTTDYAEGPITALVIIDLARWREATAARTVKGFVVPEAFDGAQLAFRRSFASHEVAERLDIAAIEPAGWRALP